MWNKQLLKEKLVKPSNAVHNFRFGECQHLDALQSDFVELFTKYNIASFIAFCSVLLDEASFV